jgi:hypothetical protein
MQRCVKEGQTSQEYQTFRFLQFVPPRWSPSGNRCFEYDTLLFQGSSFIAFRVRITSFL